MYNSKILSDFWIIPFEVIFYLEKLLNTTYKSFFLKEMILNFIIQKSIKHFYFYCVTPLEL